MGEERTGRRTAIITGASGYVGGRLALRLISQGWSVHAVIRPVSRASEAAAACESRIVYDGTATSLAEPISAIRPDVVYHLASEFGGDGSVELSEKLVLSNVLFPVQLVHAMLAAGCDKLINTGTFWQHYQGESYRPVDLYAATKQAAEDLLLVFHQVDALSCVTLTLFDNYGPADPRRKLLSLLLGAVGGETPLGLSPGEQVIDLTHVEDVVDAFRVAADAMLDAREPIWDKAFVSGERMTVRGLVQLLTSTLHAPVNVRFGARPYRPRDVMMPIAPRPSSILSGWRPRRRLQDELPLLARDIAGKREDAA